MGLGKRKQTSVFDRLRYNARTGVMFKVTRVLDNNEWFNDEAPIEHAKFLGVFDLENLLIGWQAYVKGVGADFRLVKVDQATVTHQATRTSLVYGFWSFWTAKRKPAN